MYPAEITVEWPSLDIDPGSDPGSDPARVPAAASNPLAFLLLENVGPFAGANP